ncbi:MAG: D-2-hydroxyacid dehydrogenase [Chryseolinea sp.]
MKIVIPDGFTLNPGDLSWEGISRFGEILYRDRTAPMEMADWCRDADIILTNKALLTASTIRQAKALKLICVTATGYNIVDIEAARAKNITVCNVPGYGTSSVAQHTFALILELANNVGTNAESVRSGAWEQSQDFSYTKGMLTELSGKTLGIVGFGQIGQQVARLAQAFDMTVLFYSRTPKESNLGKYATLQKLFSTCDIVSLHCPLTNDNEQFVNLDLLKIMKPSAWLINTSRGQLINEAHLADALKGRLLAAAAVDVLSVEPPPSSNPLLSAQNCLITPHNAWMSPEARKRILKATENNISAFLSRSPVNVV